jgi:hypothetical protein
MIQCPGVKIVAALLVALSSVVQAVEPTGSKIADESVTKKDTRYKISDRYTFRVLDQYSKVERSTFTETISAVKGSEVVYNNGQRRDDLLGNYISNAEGIVWSGVQMFPPEYSVGKAWTTDYQFTRPNGTVFKVVADFKIVAKETITVPAGTFDTYRIEGRGSQTQFFGGSQQPFPLASRYTIWVSPDRVRTRYIAQEFTVIRTAYYDRVATADRTELISYKQAD